MRLESIHAINTNDHNKSHSKPHVAVNNGKSTSGLLFEDYLNAYIQQSSKPVITRHAENQVAGLLMGYISPLRFAYKSEPELEISAS